MTGTNITVLDNFFYNIEKNIFFYNSSTVTEACGKRELPDWIKKKKKTQLQTNRNWIHGPHFNRLSFCLDPPSSQTDLPFPPPSLPHPIQEAMT